MRMLVWKYLAEFVGILNVIYLMYWSIEMSENLHKNSILYW